MDPTNDPRTPVSGESRRDFVIHQGLGVWYYMRGNFVIGIVVARVEEPPTRIAK